VKAAPAMTPRKLIEWCIAIAFVIVLFVGMSVFVVEFYSGSYSRLNAFVIWDRFIKDKIDPFAITLPAAVIATIVVMLFRTTKGPLHFKVAGIELSGPTGQVILWSFIFMAIALTMTFV
jgi:hypothetical protein